MKELQDYIKVIPDFPEPGILFRDLTSVLQDADGFKLAIDSLLGMLEGVECDAIAGIESRGFILGSPLAYTLNKPFVLVRKQGKLPRETVSQEYELEYGTAILEIHTDAIKPGQKVVIVDDLMATGGTLTATAKLIEKLGGEVSKIICLMELAGFNGRGKLTGYNIETAITFEGK